MGNDGTISTDIAVWNINMFCLVSVVTTYICMIISLYSLIEINICGEHKQNGNIKHISRLCVDTGNEKYLSFVNVCYRLRNSIAHCNASILRNSLAFRTVIAALDEQDFTGILKFLLGSSYNQIDVKLLYSNLSNFQIKWNPPLNSSKEIFLDYHKKTRELENKLKTI